MDRSAHRTPSRRDLSPPGLAHLSSSHLDRTGNRHSHPSLAVSSQRLMRLTRSMCPAVVRPPILVPPTELIRLDIPEPWRVWLAYRLSGWSRSTSYADNYWINEWSYHDPVDLVSYDESTAFPAMKPNFDVISVPRRTRKQRGWYQISGPVYLRPAQSLCFAQSQARLITWQEFPPELMLLVLWHLDVQRNPRPL